jgi:hypothetical protein
MRGPQRQETMLEWRFEPTGSVRLQISSDKLKRYHGYPFSGSTMDANVVLKLERGNEDAILSRPVLRLNVRVLT